MIHRRKFLLTGLLMGASQSHAESIGFELQPAQPHVLGDGMAYAQAYRASAQAVIAVIVNRLALPFPSARMLVFEDHAAFEAALIEHLKLSPEVAKTTASFAKAAVGPGHLLLNHPAMQTIGQEEQLITMAHEMTHLVQAALNGGRALWRYHWLTEGFAEWVAFRVVYELGAADFSLQRQKMLIQVRPIWQAGQLARLEQMDRFDEWVKVRAARGFNATYPFAFFAAEFLIERHTLPQVTAYFRAFSQSTNAANNFQVTFGETLQDFQLDLNVQLKKLFQL